MTGRSVQAYWYRGRDFGLTCLCGKYFQDPYDFHMGPKREKGPQKVKTENVENTGKLIVCIEQKKIQILHNVEILFLQHVKKSQCRTS